LGKRLLRIYNRFKEFIQDSLKNPELWESYGLKIDIKNRLKGKIIEIEKDEQVCKLRINVDKPQIINSIITTESVNELGLEDKKEVIILIKATEIQVGMGE
jgi:molybdopterin-binding protein